jgi:hypothetical chaperone protein
MIPVIGIDFGTTNSVVSFLNPDGSSRTIRFGAEALDVFRTVLCFWSEQVGVGSTLHHAAGPAAIQAYLDDPLDSRLIMSMKTYLAQRSFTETRIFGRRYTLENLIATFLRALLLSAGQDPAQTVIVAGRPVRFAGENPDDDFGATRLRAAFAEAGLTKIDMALEPEGAGYRFARGLTHPANVLIGDFGGGTSDFSILRFEPAGRTGPGDAAGRRVTALGNSGIGIAGDVFDYRIIDRVISPRLGKGDNYTVMGKKLPVPIEYFSSFARWHRLSLMRNPRTLRSIEEVARTADHPERLRSLIRLIDDELGYQLYQTVSAVKAALSRADTARLEFCHKELVIDEVVHRVDFESWIAADLAQLEAAVDRVLVQSGLEAGAIDHVFLTGGTSFVPAVRAIFARRFGADRVEMGGEFVSVAEGLALIGRDRAVGA